MKQALILLSIVLFSNVQLFSQVDYSNFKDSDSEATQLLDRLYRYIADAPDYTVDFSLTLEYPGEQPQSESGTLSQSNNNYVLNLESQAIYANEDTQWTHLKTDNEVMIDNRDPDDLSDNLSLTPLGLLGLYQSEEFVYAILNTEPFESSTRYFVEFKPLDQESDYSKMRINIVDNKVPTMEQITIFNKDASRYVINVADLKINNGLTKADFSFDKSKYPDIHVEDIRL